MKLLSPLFFGGIILLTLAGMVFFTWSILHRPDYVGDYSPRLGCSSCCTLFEDVECELLVSGDNNSFFLMGGSRGVPTDPPGGWINADIIITDLTFTKSGGSVNCSLDKTGLSSTYETQPALVFGHYKVFQRGPAVLFCTPFELDDINGTWTVKRTAFTSYENNVSLYLVGAERSVKFEVHPEYTNGLMPCVCVR